MTGRDSLGNSTTSGSSSRRRSDSGSGGWDRREGGDRKGRSDTVTDVGELRRVEGGATGAGSAVILDNTVDRGRSLDLDRLVMMYLRRRGVSLVGRLSRVLGAWKGSHSIIGGTGITGIIIARSTVIDISIVSLWHFR